MDNVSHKIVRRLNILSHVRPERLIHSLDGIEDVVSFNKIKEIVSAFTFKLNDHKINLSEVDFLIGVDSGGITPTLVFASLINKDFKLAWKLNLDIEDKLVFTEKNASGQEVFLYNLQRDKKVIIVDDEITSGATIVSLCHELSKRNIKVLSVLTIFESNKLNREWLLNEIQCPLISLYKF